MIADGRARFGTDHFRFKDPSYLNLRAGTFIIINTQTGAKMSVFENPVQISNLTWDEKGEKLVFFEQKDNNLVLG